jgi:hypothetical protein
MIIPKDTQVRFPVRCINASGDGVTGLLPAQISDGTTAGNVTVIKADGTLAAIVLVNNTNWFQVNGSKAPGLYHVVLPSSVTNILGALQLAVFPAATDFKGAVFTGEVKLFDDAAEANLGRWQIFASGPNANKLILYKSDGVTILRSFDLKDAVGDPTYTNPFARIPA